MSRSMLSVLSLTLLSLGISVLPAQAGPWGLFGRRWERRKAELYSELSGSLSAELDDRLTEEMRAARAELAKEASRQIDEEAAALKAQVERHLAELRQEAAKLVEAESRRLQKQVEQEITKMREEAKKLVADEAKRLALEVAKVQKELRGQVQEQLGRLPQMVDERVEARWKEWERTHSSSNDSSPADRGDSSTHVPPANNDAARVRVTESESDNSQ